MDITKNKEKVFKGFDEKHRNGEGKPQQSHCAQSSYKPEQHAMVTIFNGVNSVLLDRAAWQCII
jgi:hypothetical protein